MIKHILFFKSNDQSHFTHRAVGAASFVPLLAPQSCIAKMKNHYPQPKEIEFNKSHC